MINTDCRKCGTPMPPLMPPKKRSAIDVMSVMSMTITAYACQKCGHWNDLSRRKKKKP